MTLVDTAESAARQENRSEISRLEQENASLRAYLDRVLVLLDSELPEPLESQPPESENRTHEAAISTPQQPAVTAGVPPDCGPSRLLRLADAERRIKRTEETLEDLVWLVTRMEHDAAAGLKR